MSSTQPNDITHLILSQQFRALEQAPMTAPEDSVNLETFFENLLTFTIKSLAGKYKAIAILGLGNPQKNKDHYCLFLYPDRVRFQKKHATHQTELNYTYADKSFTKNGLPISGSNRVVLSLRAVVSDLKRGDAQFFYIS